MKNALRKIYDFFARPFTDNFTLLLLVSALVCTPMLIGLWRLDHSFSIIVWEIMHSYLLVYFALLIVSNLPYGLLKKMGVGILIVLAVIDLCVEVCCWYTTGHEFGLDAVAIIMATNINEINEFVGTYISPLIILTVILGVVSIVGLVHRLTPKINKVGRKIALGACTASLVFIGYFLLKGTESWGHKFYTKFISFASYQLPPDLREYRKPLELEYIAIDRPQIVLLILGESFARSHSSLYGYDKETNPHLSQLRDSSLLCVYNNAVAPATNTIPCVKSIMSTWEYAFGDSVNWYQCETLPNIMSSAGYNTVWISNQSPSGAFDNVAARYAELCDTTIWVGNKYKGVNKTDFDEEILKELRKNTLFNKGDNYFIVLHLIGSHCDYSMRYPTEWQEFHKDDYLNYPAHQRKILSDYDNSVLYNDFIVSEILKFFSDKECIAYYFSDHSLDLFESSDDYFGYGKLNSPSSLKLAMSIPYMIYGSKSFQTRFPNKWNTIKLNSLYELYTTDTIYHIMDILGIRLLMDD